jgi:hypothetical protein
MVGVYVILAMLVLLAALELTLYVIALLADPSMARRVIGLVVYSAVIMSISVVLTIATQGYITRRFRPKFMRLQDRIDRKTDALEQQAGFLSGAHELIKLTSDKTKLMLTELESMTEGMERETRPGRLKIVISPDGVELHRLQQNMDTGNYEPLATPSSPPIQWRVNEEAGHYQPIPG